MKKIIFAIFAFIPFCSQANNGTAFDGAQGSWGMSIGQNHDSRMRIAEVYPGVWKRITKDGKVDDSTTEVYNGIWVTKTKNKGNTSDFGDQQQGENPVGGISPQTNQSQEQKRTSYSNGSVKVKPSSYGNFGTNINSNSPARRLDDLINN